MMPKHQHTGQSGHQARCPQWMPIIFLHLSLVTVSTSRVTGHYSALTKYLYEINWCKMKYTIRSIVCEASCHLVIRSSSHQVNRSSSHPVICSSCHLVIRSSGNPVIQSHGHLVNLSSSHLPCHPVILSPCHPVIVFVSTLLRTLLTHRHSIMSYWSALRTKTPKKMHFEKCRFSRNTTYALAF